ncbi:SIMPL domain-containing protein [Bacillus sp. M6-12]|uniref:SIMPL domain-containing protein n=1 Tax=Bacillus sp. M6-12 TaxID=2054166 RepID=UPI002155EFB2|nr:SIMPL domain-containing protein [Bacillus sp. M6-12]
MKVSGEGSVTAAPDRAIVTVGVITEGNDPEKAQTENAAAITRIVNALVAIGIPRENIRTADYRIEPQYDYKEGQQIFKGYKVTHLLRITVEKIEQTGTVLDTAVKNGANYAANIEFSISNPEAYYNQALSLALKNAYGKAITIAQTLDVHLIATPIHVEEVSQAPSPLTYKSAEFAAIQATQIQPGEQTISALIRAQYIYS